uniref:BHLH domain-containing protein n=1 Tax=Panagrellus redivivus TaxID=6233 RepID=A0A7E4WEB6_PANRE
MVKSEYADDEMIMSGKTSCNEEEDEDMGSEWTRNPNSVSTEERSPPRGSSDNTNDSSRNRSTTPLDDRRLRRQIANCNERRRMQSINAGFQALRSLLPRKDGEKMSKAAILQHTADYIQSLQDEKTRLVNENRAIAQTKKRKIIAEAPMKMEIDSSTPVITSQSQTNMVSPDVMEYLRTIEDLKLALSKEHRLRIIYEREVLEMRNKSLHTLQEHNASLGVLRAAAGMDIRNDMANDVQASLSALLSSQSLGFDANMRGSDSASMLLQSAVPHTPQMPPPPPSTDSLLLAASQQVYNSAFYNAAAAASAAVATTTPPSLANVTPSQLSPHHQSVVTNPSSPFHQPQMRPTLGDLVVSSSSGMPTSAANSFFDATSIPSLNNSCMPSQGQHHSTFTGLSPKGLPSVTPPTSLNARQQNQRNLQAIFEAIRHIEGNSMSHVGATSSPPPPHSADLLVR